jgi:replicative DNA helicase Mcm
MDINHDLVQNLERFFEQYCKDHLAEVAQSYPKDTTSVYVDYHDLYRFDPDLADDVRKHPTQLLPHMEEAADMVELPADVDLSGVTVRVTNIPGEHTYSPGEVRKEQAGEYVGISGTLERVTTTDDLPETMVFECIRCKTTTTIPQDTNDDDLREPHECKACERQGPFKLATEHPESEWSDYAKLRISSRPGSDGDGKLTGYCLNDLVDAGGDGGLLSRAGEPVTVYGVIERVQKTGRGENTQLFDHQLHAKAVEFDRDRETIDVDAHRDEFQALADHDDAVDRFAESIAPNLHETDAWSAAMEFAVAYLAGAPRIDLEDGPTYRGDLHFLILSDYGMGKSTFKKDIEAYSPKCISKSTTALSSGVGLTAAAVKDDFGEGQWTIKPGLLVRANGGHLILDEIDKGPDELTEMNDAIEGQQQVDIEKAGKSATYESRTGIMALGNPVDGRFNPHEPIADQLGIDESLLSRFDGIVTMEDVQDESQDRNVAETFGRSYIEAQQSEYGDRDDFDELDRPVPVDVGRAWLKYARENVDPLLTYERYQELEDWYADEVRKLNKNFAEAGDAEDMPVPATVRELAATVKMAIAFARIRLQDEVQGSQIERAKKLGKRLIKQNWNGEEFDATKNVGSQSQLSRKDRLKKLVREHDGDMAHEDLVEQMNADESQVEHDIEQLKHNGILIEPKQGTYRYA